jgi:hypothetical protein
MAMEAQIAGLDIGPSTIRRVFLWFLHGTGALKFKHQEIQNPGKILEMNLQALIFCI